jgi:hypothetical protein
MALLLESIDEKDVRWALPTISVGQLWLILAAKESQIQNPSPSGDG